MNGQDWMNAFGSELNQGSNSATVVAGNGTGNFIGGNVTANADQHVGDTSFGLGGYHGMDTNLGQNSASVLAGNGAFNQIDGNVSANAHQDIGDHSIHLPILI